MVLAVNQEFGKRVKMVRQSRHLRQEDVAAKLGMTRANLSNIETGRCSVSVAMLLRIADTLGVSGSWLVAEMKFSAEQPVPRCLNPVGPALHPRLGLGPRACVLLKEHNGFCQPGGNCMAHGEYVGERCPKWPACVEGFENATADSVTGIVG